MRQVFYLGCCTRKLLPPQKTTTSCTEQAIKMQSNWLIVVSCCCQSEWEGELNKGIKKASVVSVECVCMSWRGKRRGVQTTTKVTHFQFSRLQSA